MEALANFAPLILIAVVFWLLLIRPAQRRQREAVAVQQSAEVGSEIMLTSGIFGIVKAAEDDTLQLEVAPGTVVKVARGAVARVVADEPDAAPAEPADSADSGEIDGQ